jgi:hypothetical protein
VVADEALQQHTLSPTETLLIYDCGTVPSTPLQAGKRIEFNNARRSSLHFPGSTGLRHTTGHPGGRSLVELHQLHSASKWGGKAGIYDPSPPRCDAPIWKAMKVDRTTPASVYLFVEQSILQQPSTRKYLRRIALFDTRTSETFEVSANAFPFDVPPLQPLRF